MDTYEKKRQLRREIAERKKSIEPTAWLTKSNLISQRIFDILTKTPHKSIGIFMSLKDEWTTDLLLSLLKESGYEVSIPRVEGDDMRFYPYLPTSLEISDKFKIREPLASTENEMVPEVIVVPGVTFDSFRQRLGRGKGYYDRYLSQHLEDIKYTIAGCFDELMVSEIPTESHDRSVDFLVTDTHIFSDSGSTQY